MPRRKKKSRKWGQLLHECADKLGVDGPDVDLDFVAVLASAELKVPSPVSQHDKWQILAKFRAHYCAEAALKDAKSNVVDFPSKKEGGSKGSAKGDPNPAPNEDFYRSPAWRKLRYRVLVAHGNCCQCCGASPEKGFPLHVDHIKPRSKFPELALEFDNLQVLCPDCNMGKSAWDQTDWRE